MSDSWSSGTLGDKVKLLSGGTPSKDTPEYWGGAVPWVTTKDLTVDRIYSTGDYLTELGAENGTRTISPGTIVMSVRGMRLAKELPVSRVMVGATFNQDLKAIIPQNDVDQTYLYYWIKGNEYNLLGLADEAAHGTKRIQTDRLLNYPFVYPPLDVQRRIAGILSAYDDLIENNTRRIKLLEQAAHDLYREWFVEFRFPGHESVGMVDSGTEFGAIPRGWEVSTIKDIVQRYPVRHKYKQTESSNRSMTPIIDQSRDEVMGFTDDDPEFAADSSHPIIIFGDHTCKMRLMTRPFSLAENVIPFSGNRGIPALYVFFAVRNLVVTQEYKRHWTDLQNKQAVLPSISLAGGFAQLVEDNFAASETLREKNANLRETRDLLLPRLVSGELDVSDLDIQIGAES